MNIYLTCYGLDTRYKVLSKGYEEIITLLKDKKVIIIPNAKLVSEDRTNASLAKKEFLKNGIEAEIIDLNVQTLSLDSHSALYLCGGEPKYLMEAIIHSHVRRKIKNFINQGGIVIGQSAGAMIFNKDYLDTSTGSLKICHNGFSYGSKMIVPHYDALPKDLFEQIPKDVFPIKDTDSLLLLKK